MKNVTTTNETQEILAGVQKKAWQRPALDILEIQSAQQGTTGTPDGHIRHHSH